MSDLQIAGFHVLHVLYEGCFLCVFFLHVIITSFQILFLGHKGVGERSPVKDSRSERVSQKRLEFFLSRVFSHSCNNLSWRSHTFFILQSGSQILNSEVRSTSRW